MKNISELLNLLSTNPSDGAASLSGKTPVTPKGTQNGTGSFQDVLDRLSSQTGNSNASGNGSALVSGTADQPPATPSVPGATETVATLSETTIAVTESVKASNPEQLAQAEQALASLAVGLAHVVQLLSQMQAGNTQQVQDALKTLGAGQTAIPGLQNLLNDLQNFLQKLPAGQNPLDFQPSQQTALVGQLFQQLLQNQQVLFGAAPSVQTTGSNAPQAGAQGTSQNAVLQVLFSETQANIFQQQGLQSSQVSINLQTFQMSATFIQQGQSQQGQAAGPKTQPLNAQSFLNNMNQALANLVPQNNAEALALPQQAVTAAGNLPAASQNDLNQNFKNLVQLLLQSGVGQAVLTTFMRNQQEAGSLTPSTNNPANQPSLPAATSMVQVAPVEAEIPPVNQAEPTTATANNVDVVSKQQPVVNPVSTATQTLTSNPANENALPSQPISTIKADTVAASAPVETTVQPTPTATPQNPVRPNIPVKAAPVEPVASQVPVETELHPAQAAIAVPPVAAAQNVQSQDPAKVSPAPAQTLAPEPLPQNEGLSPSEIATLNDTVARMNASALHAITGSIGGNTNAIPDSNLTMGQVISSLSATRLSNTEPPTFGNPSVPINAPLPHEAGAPLNNVRIPNAAVTVQTSVAPTAASNAAPSNTAQSAIVSSSPAVSVAPLLSEPVTPNTVPALPAAVPMTPNPLGNGTAAPTAVGNNTANVATVPAATAPTVVVNPAPATPPNTLVPLPQPATLPVGTNAPAAPVNNPAGAVQTFTLASLNQVTAPQPTSQAPVVPATAAVGEGVKAEIPATTVPRNENFANPSAVANTQALSSVIPVSPEAVAPAGPLLSTTGLGVLNVLDKNSINNASVLENNTLVGLANAANQALVNTHTSSPTSLSSAPAGNFNAVNILNQISQQVAAQTAQSSSVSRLNFQLVPESLGRVTVQIALVDQSVSARIVVTNPDVRDALQTHMVDLKSALHQAGLQIDQLQVQVGGGGGGNLLAQYYQYQQEGFGYRLPVSPVSLSEGTLSPENSGNAGVLPSRTSLVDVLA